MSPSFIYIVYFCCCCCFCFGTDEQRSHTAKYSYMCMSLKKKKLYNTLYFKPRYAFFNMWCVFMYALICVLSSLNHTMHFTHTHTHHFLCILFSYRFGPFIELLYYYGMSVSILFVYIVKRDLFFFFFFFLLFPTTKSQVCTFIETKSLCRCLPFFTYLFFFLVIIVVVFSFSYSTNGIGTLWN